MPSSWRHGLGAQRADVGAGLGLGQVHRAGPLAGHHLRQVDLALLLAAVVQQHVDGALGEQRGHGERHVRRGHELLDDDADEPREAAAAVGGGERDRPPAGVDVLLVGLDEAGWRRDRPRLGVEVLPTSSPTRLSGAITSATKRPYSSMRPFTSSGETPASGSSWHSSSRSTRSSSTKSMSRSGGR